MKKSFFLLLLLMGSNLYGQSDSIEQAILYKKVFSQEILPDEYSKIALKWTDAMKKIEYPDLPLDQNGLVHYSYLNECKNITKEKIFSRALEWFAINYGLIPANLYSNLEDGKIILKNGFDIKPDYTCNYTGVITIKNEKILIEFVNIGYQIFIEGHYSGDAWVSDKTTNFGINKVYPIILKKSSEWDSNLSLLKTTNEQLDAVTVNLLNFILNYDYTF